MNHIKVPVPVPVAFGIIAYLAARSMGESPLRSAYIGEDVADLCCGRRTDREVK
jgi:hypothetical protein